MGAAKKLKMILVDREMTQADLAKKTGRAPQTLRNMLSRDNMSFDTVAMFADVLECDVVFRDRRTGKLYE